MTLVGQSLLTAIDFLTTPTWHLVVLYIVLLLIVAWRMVKEMGF